MKRKLLSILLTLCLAFSLLPATALAADGDMYVEVNGTQYANFYSAISAAKAGDTVTLLKDINVGGMTITVNKEIIVDLGGNTVTGIAQTTCDITKNATVKNGTIINNYSKEQGRAISIDKDITVTLNNVKTQTSGNGYGVQLGTTAYRAMTVNVIGDDTVISGKVAGIALYNKMVNNKGAAVTDTITLNVEAGEISGSYGIAGNGSENQGNTIVSVKGGTIKTTAEDGAAIYQPQKGELNISGGTITGMQGVQICSGTVSVTGNAQITATGADNSANKTGDGSIPDGAAVSVVKRGYPGGDPTVSITGGTITSADSVDAVQVYQWENNAKTNWNVDAFITGGTFSSDVSAYLADDYIQTEDGTVESLSVDNAVAKIGETPYKTLAAAYAAAAVGTEIKLLKDAEDVDLTGQSDKMVTIDLNGHGLTGKITKSHDLTIKDSSNDATGTAHFNYVQCNVLVLSGGKVTIDDAKIDHTVQITDANVTINGGVYQLGGTEHTAAINKQADSGSLTVNSGRFWTSDNLKSGDTEVVSYTDENSHTWYTVGKKTPGSYTIKKTGSNGDLYFYDLTTAALAAGDGDTITLLADQTVTAPVVVNNSVTIDGGGHNIQLGDSLKSAGILDNYAHGVFQFKGDGKAAAVRNFAFADIEINTVLLRAYNSGSNSTLTVKGCSFTNIKVMNVIRAASGSAASSRLVVTGCTFESCTASSNGIIQIDSNSDSTKNATSEIMNNDFIGNKTEVSGNTAIVYLSAPAKVENNYFKDNTTKADNNSSKNGIVVTGSNAGGSVIQENAFVGHLFANGDAQGAIYGAKGATTVSKNYYLQGIVNLANPGEGFAETTTSDKYLKEVGKPGVKTDLTGVSLTAGTYEYPSDDFSALVASGYRAAKSGDVWTWTVSKISSSSGSSTSAVTAPKADNGTVTVTPSRAAKGDTVTVTVKPDSGYVLETLTVTDKNGNELTLKDKGNGKYTFTMPAGKVEVKATFMEDNSVLNFFYDVPNDAYFYEAVKWAVKNGITDGVGNNLFAPEQPCTRAQIVTFLWRAAGSPEPKGAASGMTDVVSGGYYEKAVAWAIENGITTGTTTSTFSPDATCTRAQAVTFLARALNAKAASAAEFSDVPTGSYFADAVAWAAANGVTEGIGGGLFGSDNDCTRGQIVTFLYRAYNK